MIGGIKKFKVLPIRRKIQILVLAGFILVGIGLLSWAAITGRIKMRAETLGGTIIGYTYDEQGNILTDVNVSVQGNYTVTGAPIETKSNSLGRYSVGGLKENPIVTFAKEGQSFGEDFTDVPDGYWAQTHIAALVRAGITKGKTATTYDPEGIVTRDQMAVFIARALAGGDSYVPSGPTTPTFTDVPRTFWAYKYIEFVNQAGVTQGCTATTYCPTNPVTRDQMAVFMARAIGLEPFDNPIPTFQDVPKTYWAYKYIETAFSNGIVAGTTTTQYNPTANVTRAQMAVFLMRAFNNYPLTSGGYLSRRGVYSVKPGQSETYDVYLGKQENQCSEGVSFNGRVFSDQKKGPLLAIRTSVNKDQLPAPYNEAERVYEVVTSNDGYFELGCFPVGQNVTANLSSDYLVNKTFDVQLPAQTGQAQSAGLIFFSDNQTAATITATVKDANNLVIPDSFLVLARQGKKYSKNAAAGTATMSIPPGNYEVSVQRTLVDKIVYYLIPLEKLNLSLKTGDNQTIDLTGLAVDREESY